MHSRTTTTRTIITEMTAAGGSSREIAEKMHISDRTVRRYRAAAKVPGTPGRREIAGQIAEEVMQLAREGMQRKAIAKQLEIAEGTVSRIARAAGLTFARCGGDRYNTAARAAEREAPAGRHDRSLSVDLAAAWAPSAYGRDGRVVSDLRHQRGLPRALRKKYDGEKGGFVKV